MAKSGQVKRSKVSSSKSPEVTPSKSPEVTSSAKSEVVEFMSLPNEMIQKIFLDLNDLNAMLKCRLISRRCRQAVDRLRITGSLAVEDPDSNQNSRNLLRYDVQRYEFSDELIGPTSVIFRTKNFNFLKVKFIKKMLSRLRKLALMRLSFRSNPEFAQFEANINQLKRLEHLQIGVLSPIRGGKLRLDHVRTLAILHNYGGQLVLTAPKLTRLAALGDWHWPYAIFCESELTHLAVPGNEEEVVRSFSRDKIEYLRFEKKTAELPFIYSVILNYPALRELHIHLMNKAAVCEIIKKKKISRNLRLAIYFSGFLIEDLADVEQLFGEATEVLEIGLPYIVANFERVRLIHCVKKVNYSDLIHYWDRLTMDEFFSKFVRIEEVIVGWAVDSEGQFVEFIKKCKLLRKLTIRCSPFSQAFFDHLHSYCANLDALKITTRPQQIQNLDFLFKHRYLRELSINRQLDYEFVHRLTQSRSTTFCFVEFFMKGLWVRLFPDYFGWHLEYADHRFFFNTNLGNFSSIKALRTLFRLIMAPVI